MDESKKEVTIYTDGGCLGNPGPGGYGVVLRYGRHEKCLSGGFAKTTNNRMEIMAAITGLEALKNPCRVTLHSDSKYVVNAISLGWADRALTIRSLKWGSPYYPGQIASIKLLGSKAKLRWSRTASGLVITMPDEKPCDHAVVFKITPKK